MRRRPLHRNVDYCITICGQVVILFHITASTVAIAMCNVHRRMNNGHECERKGTAN